VCERLHPTQQKTAISILPDEATNAASYASWGAMSSGSVAQESSAATLVYAQSLDEANACVCFCRPAHTAGGSEIHYSQARTVTALDRVS